MFHRHLMIMTIFLRIGLFLKQVVVKFNMPSNCNVSHLIVDLVTHIGLEAEQHGGGSEVLVRAWDRLAKKVYFITNALCICNYLSPFMASINHNRTISALIFVYHPVLLWVYMLYVYWFLASDKPHLYAFCLYELSILLIGWLQRVLLNDVIHFC
jgi:hypothetical protein